MTTPLALCRPLPIAAIAVSSGAGSALLLSQAPREVWTAGGAGGQTIDLDLGAAADVDTFFLGFTNALAGVTVTASLCTAMGASPAALATAAVALPYEGSYPAHGLVMLAAPVNGRFFRLSIAQGGGGPTLQAGIVAVGRSFRPIGHDYGSGRGLDDTGSATRLADGSFAVDDGVAAPNWQWTMSDLGDGELRQLWALARNRRTTRSLLVVEDPDPAVVGLNERIHWGLFGKFERYERRDANLNRWALTVLDWV